MTRRFPYSVEGIKAKDLGEALDIAAHHYRHGVNEPVLIDRNTGHRLIGGFAGALAKYLMGNATRDLADFGPAPIPQFMGDDGLPHLGIPAKGTIHSIEPWKP